MIKITHITSTLLDGGAERFVLDVCNELSELPGVEVHLICLFDIAERMFLAKELKPAVQVHTLGKKRGFDLSVSGKILRKLKEINPDVVNTHLRTLDYTLKSVGQLKVIKYFHTVHNDALAECPRKWLRILRKKFYKSGRVYPITISELSSESFREVYGLDVDKMIYYGRRIVKSTSEFTNVKEEIESYRITEKTKIILTVGRISPQKNQILMVKTIQKLVDEGHDVVLLLIGAMRKEFKHLHVELLKHESDRIRLLGIKSNVDDYLLASDYFSLSSDFEGLPLTMIEALSAGCIPVCTPAGGIPNMIEDGQSGYLAKDFTEKDLYDAFIRALGLGNSDRDIISQRATDNFNRKFSIESSAMNYLNYYKSKIKP